MKFSDMAERQILKAQAEGQFDNLKGAGQPLNPSGDGSADSSGSASDQGDTACIDLLFAHTVNLARWAL